MLMLVSFLQKYNYNLSFGRQGKQDRYGRTQVSCSRYRMRIRFSFSQGAGIRAPLA
jgi:hypothetical protein